MAPLHPLQADVHVAPETLAQPIREGDHPFNWSPIASTLIRGKHSAVLVDTAITIEQNTQLADWVDSLLKPQNIKLESIYITHGHADHFLGLPILRARWPDVRILATMGTIVHMKSQLEEKAFAGFWGSFFPNGQLPDREDVPVAEPLPESNTFELEGHTLEAVEVGHTDTHDTTVLWVKDLKLVVAGDVVYGDVHQYLVEANTKKLRLEWIAALEKVLALKPETVVAGHKRPGGLDSVSDVHSSIAYIKDFQALIDSGVQDKDVLYQKHMEKYGGRVNPHALAGGCLFAVRNLE
jgi:glyoxylase-like metal-dependent hydrolase (beta-lactamase superfamily II)